MEDEDDLFRLDGLSGVGRILAGRDLDLGGDVLDESVHRDLADRGDLFQSGHRSYRGPHLRVPQQLVARVVANEEVL